jgi:hypothetical protein
VLAIDIDLGIVNWVHQLPLLDAYSAGCGFPGIRPPNITLCPEVPGLDTGFAMAPAFVLGSSPTPYGKDTLVIGQKNENLTPCLHELGQFSGQRSRARMALEVA